MWFTSGKKRSPQNRKKKTGRQKKRVRFTQTADLILENHDKQTLSDARALSEKYQESVFGHVPVWELIEKLALCIDPTDKILRTTTQYHHTLQVIEAMETAGVSDPDMYLAALLHYLGKLLLLTDEKPENIVCLNKPIGEYESGTGLKNVVFQWNHDEFVYSRFRGLVPRPVEWLLRYHSIRVPLCRQLMDEEDEELFERYFQPFRRFDQGSKSASHIPAVNTQKYRTLIEQAFPEPVAF